MFCMLGILSPPLCLHCLVVLLQVLLQVDGDVDAAIEFLIAEQGAEECTAANDSLTCHANGSYGNGRSVCRQILDISLGFPLHFFSIFFFMMKKSALFL